MTARAKRTMSMAGAGWLLVALLGCMCGGPRDRDRAADRADHPRVDSRAAWEPARARVRAWTGCELPADAGDVLADEAHFMNSIIDVRFTATATEVDTLVECLATREALLPGPYDGSSMVPMSTGMTELQHVDLAYDVPRRHHTLVLEVGVLGPDRHAVRVSTVAEPGSPPRGPAGTILTY